MPCIFSTAYTRNPGATMLTLTKIHNPTTAEISFEFLAYTVRCSSESWTYYWLLAGLSIQGICKRKRESKEDKENDAVCPQDVSKQELHWHN